MVILPRGLETILNLILKRFGIKVSNEEKWEIFVFSIIIGILHYYYQNEVKKLLRFNNL
jgi:hypothetical protein